MKVKITTRVDPSTAEKIKKLATKKELTISTLCCNILKAYFANNLNIKESLFFENLKSIVPDLRSQKEEMYQLKETINGLISQSEEAYENINDMKRGEGFYFKAIYETLKEQKEAFNTLCTTDVPKSESPSSLSEIRKKMGLDS
jgi:hypothetical protein